jgi:PKHD-type hydroxylase
MILKYYYWYFVSAIPEHICDQIIELGLTQMVDESAKFGDQVLMGSTGGWKHKRTDVESLPSNNETVSDLLGKGKDLNKIYLRDSHVTFLDNSYLYDLVWPFVHEANKNAGWNFDWDYTEEMQFTKYGINQFYGWHTDCAELAYRKFDPEKDPYHMNADGTPFLNQYGEKVPEDHNATTNPSMFGKIRKLSVTISLNDQSQYDGGNLQFDLGPHRPDRFHTCTEIRPKGSVIVFPSYVHHQVTPVTRGTRYSLVCWNLGAPFR